MHGPAEHGVHLDFFAYLQPGTIRSENIELVLSLVVESSSQHLEKMKLQNSFIEYIGPTDKMTGYVTSKLDLQTVPY